MNLLFSSSHFHLPVFGKALLLYPALNTFHMIIMLIVLRPQIRKKAILFIHELWDLHGSNPRAGLWKQTACPCGTACKLKHSFENHTEAAECWYLTAVPSTQLSQPFTAEHHHRLGEIAPILLKGRRSLARSSRGCRGERPFTGGVRGRPLKDDHKTHMQLSYIYAICRL